MRTILILRATVGRRVGAGTHFRCPDLLCDLHVSQTVSERESGLGEVEPTAQQLNTTNGPTAPTHPNLRPRKPRRTFCQLC